jgi:ribose transport system ATP-binding protein
MPALLEMSGIGKSFGGVPVLVDVGLSVAAGEVVALLGANGAGKSTLVKILSGAYQRDVGTVRLDGQPVVFADSAGAIAHGVRLLPQEVSVLPHLSVAENIFAGDLPVRRRLGIPVVDKRRMRAETRTLLGQLGLDLDPDRLVGTLAVTERRIVEIARAIAGRARLLIMDEPTAALTEHEARRLFEVIGRLRAQSVGIVYISHYLDEVFAISDAIVVLRDGRNAGRFVTSDASREAILLAMLGSRVEGLYPPAASVHGPVVCDIESLSVTTALRDIRLDIRAGEVMGVFGLLGSGIEVIGRALYGALGRPAASRISLDGKPYTPTDPIAAKAAGIGFVAAERKQEGIIPDLSVRENTTLPFLDRYRAGPGLSRARERTDVRGWIAQLGIRTTGTEQALRFLSGGNQQKVCLARWMAEGMKLLVLEEPTRGVDVGARREIYAALRRLTQQGLALLVISSDAEEIAGLSDRMIVLERGRVVGRFDHGASAANLLEATNMEVAA